MPDPCPTDLEHRARLAALAQETLPAGDAAAVIDFLERFDRASHAYHEHRRGCAVCRARVAELATIAGVSADGESEQESEVGGQHARNKL